MSTTIEIGHNVRHWTTEMVSDIANRLVNAYEWPANERREFRSDELAELLEHAVRAALGIETI